MTVPLVDLKDVSLFGNLEIGNNKDNCLKNTVEDSYKR